MKAANNNWSYSNENREELHNEMGEGFPVYPGSEEVYDLELGPSTIYGFNKNNEILWRMKLVAIN